MTWLLNKKLRIGYIFGIALIIFIFWWSLLGLISIVTAEGFYINLLDGHQEVICKYAKEVGIITTVPEQIFHCDQIEGVISAIDEWATNDIRFLILNDEGSLLLHVSRYMKLKIFIVKIAFSVMYTYELEDLKGEVIITGDDLLLFKEVLEFLENFEI